MTVIETELNQTKSMIAKLESGSAQAEEIAVADEAKLATISAEIQRTKSDGASYERTYLWQKRRFTQAATEAIATLEDRWRSVQTRRFRIAGIIEDCSARAFVQQARRKLVSLVKSRDELIREQTRRRKLDQAAEVEARRRERARADAALAQRVKESVRTTGAQVKRGLRGEHRCPYCGGELGAEPHADHIHPVAKGGLSTERNMVLVCKPCNLAKRDKTLNQFINSRRLDRDLVYERLSQLSKDF